MGARMEGQRQLQDVLEIVRQDRLPLAVGEPVGLQRYDRAAGDGEQSERDPGNHERPRQGGACDRLAGEYVDDPAKQHWLGELRCRKQEIDDREQPAQRRLLAEQLENAGVDAEDGHGGEELGATAGTESAHTLIRDRPRDIAQAVSFAQLINRPATGGKNPPSKMSPATGRLRNLKSCPIWSIARSMRAGSMPPRPLRLTSSVRMLSARTVRRRSSSRSRSPSSMRLAASTAARAGSLTVALMPAISARTNPFTASGLAAAKAGLTTTAKP